jgi:hypothetical protein
MNGAPGELQEEAITQPELSAGDPGVNAGIQEIRERLAAPPALLPRGIQNPVTIVGEKRELILPNDQRYITECAEQCFPELAKKERFFRQGSLLVELVECAEKQKLVELSAEAFRSRLETYFALRSYVVHNGELVLKQKLCSLDNAKALLATEAAFKHLPIIQAVVNSPVFAEDEKGQLVVLNQGYHNRNGGIYVLRKREIETDIEIDRAVKALLEIVQDFCFLRQSDKSRCVAGIISPALRFGRLLDADFPLDYCEADQSQTGKTFRMNLICSVYGESPCVVVLPSESKKGVGSLDELLSAALLSGAPFITLDNLRGEISNQLLESAIRGQGKVPVRSAYSKPTQIETDHVYWIATSNKAQTTRDLANRSIITRLRKRPWNYKFREYAGTDLLAHVERKSDYYLSCIFAVIRQWHLCGKPRTDETRHDFREWSQTLDWVIQNIFELPPLLDDHHNEQLRISSPGLSFLREVALAVQTSGQCGEELSATEIAAICDAAAIDVQGCRPGAEPNQQSRRIGSLFGPLFKESEVIEVEGFVVKRVQEKAYDEERKEYRPCKFYCFEKNQEICSR